jgi:pyrroline-5-carboxylate reductase
LDVINAFFTHFGQVLKIDESLMNAFIASSGSGIAYVYAMMDAVISESQSLGFSDHEAKALVLKTFEAAVLMAIKSPLSLEALISQVASKGGTTEAGLATLQTDLQRLIHDTFDATLIKAKELSK